MNTLPLTFLAPLIGYLLLSFSRGKFSENTSAAIGVGSMGVSASATALAILGFDGGSHEMVLWTWMAVGDFRPAFGLHLDGLSLTMLGVITGVGFLIHLFASLGASSGTGSGKVISAGRVASSPMALTIAFIFWKRRCCCQYSQPTIPPRTRTSAARSATAACWISIYLVVGGVAPPLNALGRPLESFPEEGTNGQGSKERWRGYR